MAQKLTLDERKRAMMIQFWEAGYGQTTVPDLAAVAGISRSQFYRQYHGKAVALRQCLQFYQQTLDQQLTLLIAQDRSRQTPLYALLADCLLVPVQSERWPAGCLMVNLMAEMGGTTDSVLTAQLQAVYADLQSRLVSLLAPHADRLPTAVAAIATSLMQVRSGLQLLARQDPGTSQLKRQAQTSVQLILKEL